MSFQLASRYSRTFISEYIRYSNNHVIKFGSGGTSEKNSSENHVVVLNSISEEIQKFDSFFSEKSHDLSQYDVRQTQAVTVQIKEKFVTLQDNLKPKKKFGFKSKHKKVSFISNKLIKCFIKYEIAVIQSSLA